MKKKIIIISSVVLSLVIAGLITLFCFLNSFPSNFELKTDIGQMLDLNELLTKDQVMVDRDKIIEYVESVHPYFDLVEDKSAYEETKRSFIEATVVSLGLRGIKLHPDFQKFQIDCPKMDDVYEVMADLKLPVLVHAGDCRYDYSGPKRIYNHTGARKVCGCGYNQPGN